MSANPTIYNTKLNIKLKSILLNSIYPFPINKILTIKLNDTLLSALKILELNNILSLPIILDDKYINIIDMNMILNYIISKFEDYKFKSYEEFENVYNSVQILKNTLISDIIKDTNIHDSINENNNMYEAMKLLSKYHELILFIITF